MDEHDVTDIYLDILIFDVVFVVAVVGCVIACIYFVAVVQPYWHKPMALHLVTVQAFNWNQ